MVEISNAEVRAARAYIYSQGLTSSDVSPRMFAMAAKELNVPFKELLAAMASHVVANRKPSTGGAGA
jgi:hypothetical protein